MHSDKADAVLFVLAMVFVVGGVIAVIILTTPT